MMEASTVGLNWAQLFIFLFGGQFLGMPPGERDAELIKTAPGNAYVYAEWTAAGAGKRGAPGFEGLMADPEIEAFVAALQTSLADANPDADAAGGIEETVRAEVPRLLWFLSRHPGCVFVAAGERRPGKPLAFPLEGAVVLNLGDDADDFMAAMNQVLTLIPGYDPVAHPQGQVLPIGGALVRLELSGQRLIVAVGDGCLERLHARWQQPRAELNDVPEYVNAGVKADVESLGSLTWLNLAGVRADLQTRLGLPGVLLQGVASAFGITGIDSVMTVSGIEQHDLVTRTQITLNGQTKGVLTLFAGRPIAAADLTQVPADADFVAAVSLDLVAVHRGIREIFAFRPEILASFDEFQRQLELELQLSFADVLHGFGDVWTIYDAPSTGGVFLTGMVAAAPVNHPGAAQAVVNRLQKWLVDSLPDDESGAALSSLAFDGVTIHYLNSPQSPFSPSFCLTDRQFLIALHPQAIKAHLRFLKSSAPRFDKNLASDFQPPQGDLLACLFVDTPQLGQAIYPLLPLILKLALKDGSDFDIGALPSAHAVLPYLRPASAAMVRRPDGLFIEQRNTAPLTLAMLLLPRLSTMMPSRSFGDSLTGGGSPSVQLGAPEGGVVPANIEEPAKAESAEPSAVEKAARRTVPFFVRTWIPDQLEGFIPPDVWQKMAQPPDPEAAEQRAAERERRAQRGPLAAPPGRVGEHC